MLLKTTSVLAVLVAAVQPASAAGELNIFTWGNLTPPALIEAFEKEYGVDVTITDYDSNDTALARVRQGGHGFDIVVPTSSYVPIWISEGLLLETRPDRMENFGNLDERWANPPYDPGSRYTVPYFVGSTGIVVNAKVYDGDIDTSAIFLDPPEELVGRINVPPVMDEVMHLVIAYMGGEPCTTDADVLRTVRDKLLEARQKWASMTYGSIDMYVANDVSAGVYWSGASFRARAGNADMKYGFPREGFPLWLDNVAVLADARNPDNAKLFQNFVMRPENGALISEFTRYESAVKGAMELLPEEFRQAPELAMPEDARENATWLQACPQEAQAMYSQIWTSIQR